MGYTYELCNFISGLSADILDDELKVSVKYRTLDWIGCVIGGLSKDSSRAVQSLIEAMGGSPDATAIGLSKKTSHANAAFANGIIGHTLEYDDGSKIAITHPGAIAVPTALSMAESYDKTVDEFMLGVVSGYEAMIRIGGALNPSHYNYWHTTGTCGAFAAAAAAGKVAGLSTERLQAAFGLAATMASGLGSVFGTDAKMVNVGNAAFNGIMAAELSNRGFSAPMDIIEMEKGYAESAYGEKDLSFMTSNLGEELMIDGAYYKMHSSCGHTHSALDALFEIISDESFSPDDIEKIEIGAYAKAVELTGSFKNSNEAQAKFSLPYCIAVGIIFGKVTLSEFTDDCLNDQRVLRLKEKISVFEDIESTAMYPQRRLQTVKITLKDRELFNKIELPTGKPSNEFLEKKFISLASMCIDGKVAEIIMEAVLNMEKFEKIGALCDILRRNV